jgi:hypothetical protein
VKLAGQAAQLLRQAGCSGGVGPLLQRERQDGVAAAALLVQPAGHAIQCSAFIGCGQSTSGQLSQVHMHTARNDLGMKQYCS